MIKRLLRIIFLWLWLLLAAIPVGAGDNPWLIMINIPECRLYLYHNGELFKTYKIAVGKVDSPSPLGEFQIINKVLNPTWYPEGKPAVPPGPGNPLGKYWLGLSSKGYGIHGNSAAWSIGVPASNGCFRMDNQEIGELFYTVPVGTPVKIVYSVVKCGIDDQKQAWLEIFPDLYHLANLDEAIQQGLAELNWNYQPHLKALACLLQQKKPLRISVPRTISIGGDYQNTEIDGFYWNDQVYISNKVVAYPSILPPGDGLFEGYLELDQLDRLSGDRFKLIWDKISNKLIIHRFRVFFNGHEINQAGRFGSGQSIMINLLKIDQFLEPGQYQELVSAALSGLGEIGDGALWISLDTLIANCGAINYQWNETAWILKLYYYPD